MVSWIRWHRCVSCGSWATGDDGHELATAVTCLPPQGGSIASRMYSRSASLAGRFSRISGLWWAIRLRSWWRWVTALPAGLGRVRGGGGRCGGWRVRVWGCSAWRAGTVRICRAVPRLPCRAARPRGWYRGGRAAWLCRSRHGRGRRVRGGGRRIRTRVAGGAAGGGWSGRRGWHYGEGPRRVHVPPSALWRPVRSTGGAAGPGRGLRRRRRGKCSQRNYFCGAGRVASSLYATVTTRCAGVSL